MTILPSLTSLASDRQLEAYSGLACRHLQRHSNSPPDLDNAITLKEELQRPLSRKMKEKMDTIWEDEEIEVGYQAWPSPGSR